MGGEMTGDDLDRACESAGMMSVTESLAVGWADVIHRHNGITDVPSLLQWAEQQRRETLGMIARHDLGVYKLSEDVYDFVLGRNAQATDIHVNLRRVLSEQVN